LEYQFSKICLDFWWQYKMRGNPLPFTILRRD
jgi:hypothetical protein